MESARSETDTSPPGGDFERTVDELLQLYTRIDRATASLPTASVPILKYFWNVAKFFFALLGDILLIIPVNIAVVIRNVFPGRWSYKCFSWPYVKAAVCWVWMGECAIPGIFFRPLAVGLLHWHFRSRPSALRHQIVLETGFSEEGAKAALAKIDRAMDVWQQRATFRAIVLTWSLPLIGPITQLWQFSVRQFSVPVSLKPSPEAANYVVILSLTYAFVILSTAFLVKRGLMLGATSRGAYYPGFLPGPGGYMQERKILSALGLEVREFPLDVLSSLGSTLLGLYAGFNAPGMAAPPGLSAADLRMLTNIRRINYFMNIFFIILVIAVAVVSSIRRRKLGRA